ncbi:MAG: hypothetical protein LC799_15125 [Actinobacteria bacterium]|nr:hypothetical protein [Actinomycetota bacterium]
MPNSAEDFETRLAILEGEVSRLREQVALSSSDAAAARVLAAGADHDVSEVRAELRAHTQALNALRDTQLEHVQEMRGGFAKQGQEMREGFAKQASGMAQITALLTKITGSPGLS